MITEFRGEYRWLSNFWPCIIAIPQSSYAVGIGIADSVEHAYQATKATTLEDFERVLTCRTAGEAKRVGQRITVRSDWEAIKLDAMRMYLRHKFNQEWYKLALLGTGEQLLIEGNTWHDNFWGVCLCMRCGGQAQLTSAMLMDERTNHLGRLLMEIREELRP